MVSTSTSRPARRIATRSHTASTSASWCELRKTVWPRSLASATQRRNSRSISGSRPLVGSSSTSSGARVANAATSATFCRLPVEYVLPGLSRSSWKRSTSSVAVIDVDARCLRCRAALGFRRRSTPATVRHRQAHMPGDGARARRQPASSPKIRRATAAGANQAEQQPNRGRLARPVRAEESEHLAAERSGSGRRRRRYGRTVWSSGRCEQRTGTQYARAPPMERTRKPFTSRATDCRPDFPARPSGLYSCGNSRRRNTRSSGRHIQ